MKGGGSDREARAAGRLLPRPLARYLRTIRLQRGDHDGPVLTQRRADVQALAVIPDVGTDELLATLGRRGLLLLT